MNLTVTLCLCNIFACICDVLGYSGGRLVENYRVDHTDSSDDILQYPYKVGTSSRVKRDCKHYAYGHRANSLYHAHGVGKEGVPNKLTLPILDSKQKTITIAEHSYDERDVLVHISYVNNPASTVSVYEPLSDGSCKSNRVGRVQQSARCRNCLLASNAGLFNTQTKACYGNIVSDGRLVQDTEGIQNAHFGITKAGELFFGYLSEIDLVKDNFIQLVGGVIWVLRDGKVNVDESIASECRDTEETGTLQKFSSVMSARTLVGHDKLGRVMVLQIEGKTGRFGANLYEAAEILKDLGAVNAINLDGGGSSTLVINDTLVNHPSDKCGKFNCARSVSTILCVHEPFCIDPECGGHGSCELGQCRCHGHWGGENCDLLECPGDCYKHGACTEVGCICLPGYYGTNCSTSCSKGWYGNQCEQHCQCENNATCDSVSGRCSCQPGYSGPLCQYRCKLGYYGDKCSSKCKCEDSCMCDPVLGTCNYTYTKDDYLQAGSCFTKKLEQKRDVEFQMIEQYQSAIVTVIITSVISFISVTLNIVLLCKKYSKCNYFGETKSTYKPARTRNGNVFSFHGKQYSSFTSSSEEEDETSLIDKSRNQPT